MYVGEVRSFPSIMRLQRCVVVIVVIAVSPVVTCPEFELEKGSSDSRIFVS